MILLQALIQLYRKLLSPGSLSGNRHAGRKLHHRCASHDWCHDVPQGHLEETRRMERRGVRPRSIHGAVEQAGIAMARGV